MSNSEITVAALRELGNMFDNERGQIARADDADCKSETIQGISRSLSDL